MLLVALGAGILLLIIAELRRNPIWTADKRARFFKRYARIGRALIRITSFVVFVSILSGLFYIASQSLWAAKDAWISPLRLNANSAEVLESHLRYHERLQELSALKAKLLSTQERLSVKRQSVQKLLSLRKNFKEGNDWNKIYYQQYEKLVSQSAKWLKQEGRLAADMGATARGLREDLDRQLAAGLLNKADYSRQLQALAQLELKILENKRAKVQSEFDEQQAQGNLAALQATESQLAEKIDTGEIPSSFSAARDITSSPSMKSDGKLLSPPSLAISSQISANSISILNLLGEIKEMEHEYLLVKESVKALERVLEKLMKQPVYQALFAETDFAFVPYLEATWVKPNQPVYNCYLGIFWCDKVGAVAQVLEGEVRSVDSWGNSVRGYYVTLSMNDKEAIKKRTLRVRYR